MKNNSILKISKKISRYGFLLATLFGSFHVAAQVDYTGSKYNASAQATNVLLVKFQDDCGFRVKGSELIDARGRSVVPNAIASSGSWKPVHHASAAELAALRKRAEKNTGRRFYDPASEFFFLIHPGADIERLKREISKLPAVAQVYFVPKLFPAVAPNMYADQTYLHDPDAGIGAAEVSADFDNQGVGVKVCDIEYSFNASHTDLPTITVLGGVPIDPFGSDNNHGTATLGEMAALDDGIGTTGIAPDATYYFAGAFVDSIYNVATAITSALTELEAGDVILLEQQIAGPNYGENQFGLVPVEWYKPFFDAIQLATAQNVTVVEAAGNGSQNLGSSEYTVGNGGHYPFMPGGAYSGAIIVGAGSVGTTLGGADVPRSRLWYSNYGSRLDLQGNGERVVTTGYGDAYSADGVNSYYAADFGGTSSASPIVAGAVALLQSIVYQELGYYLSPEQAKYFLVATGKPQTSGGFSATQHIGPLPNLPDAVEEALLNAPPLSAETINEPAWKITVSPNPGYGHYQLSGIPTGDVHLTLYNLTGQKIQSKVTRLGSKILLDITGNPAGCYFVKISGKDRSISRKLILLP